MIHKYHSSNVSNHRSHSYPTSLPALIAGSAVISCDLQEPLTASGKIYLRAKPSHMSVMVVKNQSKCNI